MSELLKHDFLFPIDHLEYLTGYRVAAQLLQAQRRRVINSYLVFD